MKLRSHGRKRPLVLLALALACTLATTGVAAASPVASPSESTDYGIPPLPNDADVQAFGGQVQAVATSGSSGVSVNSPKIGTFSHFQFCLALPGGGSTFETCCPDPDAATCSRVDPPKTSIDDTGSLNWFRIKGKTWIDSPAGASPTFGTFPPIQIKTKVAGRVVTATANLTQVKGADGYVTPLSFFYEFSSELPPGTTVQGYGTVPESPYSPGSGSFVYLPTTLTGNVNIRLGDLRVAGVPVDVGSTCRTANPGALNLGAPGGFAGKPTADTPVSAYYGKAGQFTTDVGGQLDGNLSIPRFTGCRTAGRNVDAVVTALVSSPTNKVVIRNTAVLDNCGSLNGEATANCPAFPVQGSPAKRTAHQR